MNTTITRITALSVLALLLCACGGEEELEKAPQIEARYIVSPTAFTGIPGETFTLSLTSIIGSAKTPYDLKSNPEHLAVASSNPGVATVVQNGTVTLKSTGECKINVSKDGKTLTSAAVTVKDNIFTEPDYDRTLDSGLIHGQYIFGDSKNPQCVDVDRNGNVWLEGVAGNEVYVQRFTKPGSFDAVTGVLSGMEADKEMILKYAGHGTTLCVDIDKTSGETYFWYSNYAEKYPASGGYRDSQVLSRTRYVPGKTIYPDEADENFYFGEKHRTSFHYLDFDNDHLAIFSPDVSLLSIYRLSEVLAAPVTKITLKPMLWGGDTDRFPTEQTLTLTISAHDCSALKPIKEFTVSKKTALKGNSCQGFCCTGKDADCYFLIGDSTDVNVGMTKVNGNTGAFDYLGREMAFDNDLNTLARYNITTSAYLEAEGVTVRMGKMYICVASPMLKKRVSTILKLN